MGNYDEFLKALNVGFLLRKAATASTPVMEITESDGNWTMKTSTSLKAIELKFKLGEPFQGDDRRAQVRDDGDHGGQQVDHDAEGHQEGRQGRYGGARVYRRQGDDVDYGGRRNRNSSLQARIT